MSHAIYPKKYLYSTRDNCFVSSNIRMKRTPFETQVFSGIKKTRKENYRGMFCTERVTSGSQTCRVSRTPLCSPIGRIARNFSLYILPSEYLKLSISLYHSYSSRYLRKDDSWSCENDIRIFYCFRSAVGVRIDNAIFKHTISLLEYDFSSRISYYVIVF